MKKSFVIYLALCTSLYAKAQYVAVDTTKLAQAYATWQQESSPANQRVFFDAFPKNWMEFIATYQYGAPFYDRADKHVHALGEMAKAIPTDEYCERLVNLCIGGELDADAPNYLRELVGEALSADSESRKGIFTCLSRLRIGHRFQFWFFYWSNIVRSRTLEAEFADLYAYAKEHDSAEAVVMADAYKYAYDGVNFMTEGYRK